MTYCLLISSLNARGIEDDVPGGDVKGCAQGEF